MVDIISIDGIVISKEAKAEFLHSLIGKVHKILHLFEEQNETGYSPQAFIAGQLIDVNAANGLFGGKLIPIIVKMKAIYDNRDTMTCADVKKQVFEIDKIIKSMLRDLK